MKNQRWKGDDETIKQEFAYSRREEDKGFADFNKSFANDYLALGITRKLDSYETHELEPSWATQLDTVGMQPHSREYLERDLTAMRSGRKYHEIAGQVIDHCDGIHFDEMP
jgi:hypothetical protein